MNEKYAKNNEVLREQKSHGCTPSKHDILCGKDRKYSKHTRNGLFRELINGMKATYDRATSKKQKMQITKDIVTFMKQECGSRFLKKLDKQQSSCSSSPSSLWVEIDDQTARDKVSHALRFANRQRYTTMKSTTPTTYLQLRTLLPQPQQKNIQPPLAGAPAQTGASPRVTGTTDHNPDSAESMEDSKTFDTEPIPFSEVFGSSFAALKQKSLVQPKQPLTESNCDDPSLLACDSEQAKVVILSRPQSPANSSHQQAITQFPQTIITANNDHQSFNHNNKPASSTTEWTNPATRRRDAVIEKQHPRGSSQHCDLNHSAADMVSHPWSSLQIAEEDSVS